MKLAAIDIGSNSIHMIIAEAGPHGSFRVMDREKDMVGLGRGTLDRNYLDEDATGRGLAVLRKYAKLAERHGVDEVRAVATSAVREALNGGDFIERIRREVGIDVNVITAVEEARLIALAVLDGLDLAESRALVIDIGGGSIEMILCDRGKLVAAESFKLGVIRLAERFLVPGARLSRAARRELVDHVVAVTGEFLAGVVRHGVDTVVGTSGTILALGALAAGGPSGPDDAPLNGRTVELDALSALADRLADMTARERLRVAGVDERRADTIAVGAAALVEIVRRLGQDEVVLCDRALREGILVDYRDRHRDRIGRHESVPSLRTRSVMELAERYGYDARHAEQVKRFALQLFDRTRNLHELDPSYRPYLEHAALLHDVGTHIAFTDHHLHGSYLIRNGGLRGFRPAEVELLAGIVRYHRRRSPRKDDPAMRALRKRDRRALRVLAGLLRVADGLDRSHFQVVRDLNVRVGGNVVSIYVDAQDDPELEVWASSRKARLFERATGAQLRFVLKRTGARGVRPLGVAPAPAAAQEA